MACSFSIARPLCPRFATNSPKHQDSIGIIQSTGNKYKKRFKSRAQTIAAGDDAKNANKNLNILKWQQNKKTGGLERGGGIRIDKRYRRWLDQELTHAQVELPDAVDLDVQATAFEVIETMVGMYREQLGARNVTTVQAALEMVSIGDRLGYDMNATRMMYGFKRRQDRGMTRAIVEGIGSVFYGPEGGSRNELAGASGGKGVKISNLQMEKIDDEG